MKELKITTLAEMKLKPRTYKFWKITKKTIDTLKPLPGYYIDIKKEPETMLRTLLHMNEKVWMRGQPMEELIDILNNIYWKNKHEQSKDRTDTSIIN